MSHIHLPDGVLPTLEEPTLTQLFRGLREKEIWL